MWPHGEILPLLHHFSETDFKFMGPKPIFFRKTQISLILHDFLSKTKRFPMLRDLFIIEKQFWSKNFNFVGFWINGTYIIGCLTPTLKIDLLKM